jgi:phenylpropionate dioxygenase-like ring-hydroxylating dioxygenase large terminal subunit
MAFGGVVTVQHPELGTGPIATEQSISGAFFEKERERIFRRVWLCVARVDEVPDPGDYTVVDLEVLKTSAIIVRGKDNEIRAFHNICTHRGNKVTRQCRGKANAFTCGFHGWVYDLRGRLSFVRDEEGFFDFNKTEHGLIPFAVGVWEGFIFVNATLRPAESLEQYLNTLWPSLKGYPFAEMKLDAMYSLTVDANWKVAQDAFQESYHVGVVHRNTAPQFSTDVNPFGRMLAYRLHKYHDVASVIGNPDPQLTPVERFARELGTSTFGAAAAAAGRQWESVPGINPARSKGFLFDLHNVFPNFAIHAGIGFYYTHSFYPITTRRTRWVLRLYGLPATNGGEAIAKEYTKIFLRDAVKEDVNTFECTQRNLESGMMPFMVLHDHEMLVRHKYKMVEAFVGSEAYPGVEARAQTAGHA